MGKCVDCGGEINAGGIRCEKHQREYEASKKHLNDKKDAPRRLSDTPYVGGGCPECGSAMISKELWDGKDKDGKRIGGRRVYCRNCGYLHNI